MKRPTRVRTGLRLVALAAALALLSTACGAGDEPAKEGSLAKDSSLDGASFTVGSKEFTEQLILCQVTILALESAGAKVSPKCGLSGSNTVREALTSGSIDMYWEYTGTAWVSHLKHTAPITDSREQYEAVAKEDLEKNKIKWLEPAPFNNTYAIAVSEKTAQELGVKTLSDYAELVKSDPEKAKLCVASEFVSRDDGLPGLEKAYGFKLDKKNLATLATGAIYNGISKGSPCTFGEVFTTDGRIEALNLTVLEDDKKFFPVYNPALNVRAEVLEKHPDLEKVLGPIAAALDTETMQKLNAEVDVEGRSAEKVARDWMEEKGFIG